MRSRALNIIDGAVLRGRLTALAHAHTSNHAELRSAAVAELKTALSDGHAVVRATLEAGGGGIAASEALALVTDEIVTALYDFTTTHVVRASNPTEGERFAVCAVGGYGRGRMAPGSDVDILFLRAWKTTPWVESVIEYMLYTLWDLGLSVGHATRTIEQSIKIARAEWTVLTALMDLRRLSGDAELPEQLSRRLSDEVFKGRAREFVAAKLEERDARLTRQGASRYMVEPDIKEGKGALRDLQLLDWLARGVSIAQGDGADFARLFAREEARTFEEAAEFFWRVRCFAHFVVGRGQDKLVFDIQPEIARLMGVVDQAGAPDVEALMRSYFLHARDVGALTRIMSAKLEAIEIKMAPRGLARLLPVRRTRARLPDERFVLESDRISFVDPTLPERDPGALIALFREVARQRVDIHPDAFAIAARLAPNIDAGLRVDATATQDFMAVFNDPRVMTDALRLMNETGILGAFVPEFGDIVARTQFNMYHSYTVDEHTLRVVDALASLERGTLEVVGEFGPAVFKRVANRRAVYLAALLHDTGKGEGDQEVEGAIKARAAAARLGLDPTEVELISDLVGAHLSMSDVAQRRDLGDPRTVMDFAAELGSAERLRLMTLLTLADIHGVGPGVLTAWKARLVQDLYTLTEAVFRGGRPSAASVRAALSERAFEARRVLVDSAPADRRAFTERWVNNLEDAYWLAFDMDAQARHRDFAADAEAAGETIAAAARWRNEGGFCELLAILDDRPGAFANLARAIASSGGDVRSARSYTLQDGRALTVFEAELTGVHAHDWNASDQLSRALTAAARGETVAAPAPRRGGLTHRSAAFFVEPSVTFDDDVTESATVIEVSGRDRPGLLADLCAILANSGMNVASAHVESYGERAMDVFYAQDRAGGPIVNANRRAALRRKLLDALTSGEPDAPRAGDRDLPRARSSTAR